MEDAFLNQIAFDEDNKCWAMEEVDGTVLFHDITQGMRMAQKSGLTEKEAVTALFAPVASAKLACRQAETRSS